MKQNWLVVGTQKNWKVSFENSNIWGLKDFRELKSLWNMLQEGDGLLFYTSKPVHGIIGFGNVATKFRQTKPLWPDEIKKREVIWPLRFEFDVEYCLSPTLWKTKRYTSNDLQMVSRMVFQCFPIEEVNKARVFLGLSPLLDDTSLSLKKTTLKGEKIPIDHEEIKACLAKIGKIQGYVVEEEYSLESSRLDVVWRRVERSVPTFAFEVQVGGDIYHAIAKLKHAYDLWNSNIFLVAGQKDRAKYLELISGTFHEIQDKIKFIDIYLVKKLLKKKLDYVEMERDLGIFK